MLLRVLRRRSIEDVTSAAELRSLEFSTKAQEPDLRPSVYNVGHARAVQIQAEHAAAVPLDLPRHFSYLNAEQFAPVGAVAAPVSSHFAYRGMVHEELQFDSVAELDAFLERILRVGQRAVSSVAVAEVQAYVCGRLAANDPEWSAFSQGPKSRNWTKACG